MGILINKSGYISLSPYQIEEEQKPIILDLLELLRDLIYSSNEMTFYRTRSHRFAASRSIRVDISEDAIRIVGDSDNSYLQNYIKTSKVEFLEKFNEIYSLLKGLCTSVK